MNSFIKYCRFFKLRYFKRVDKKILIYLIFVAISAFFWFTNTLSKNYTTTIEYPVRYINYPKNKILISNLPSKLNLKINSYGYRLLEFNLTQHTFPLIINLKSFSKKLKKNNKSYFYLVTKNHKNELNKQINSEIKILEILPDTIYFRFDSYISKKVAVKPNVKVNCEKQCQLTGKISCLPDSIVIKGLNTMLDTIDTILTEYKEFSDINKPIKRDISLMKINKVKFSKEKVEVNIPVEKFTEDIKKIPITILNLPDSLSLRLFPRKVTASYLVSLSDYKNILPEDFEAIINYDSIDTNSPKIKINITKSPQNVKSLRFFPMQVEYIIEK
ncbi:MAG: YbbR-like domain-containing protein [Bacteroidetes bacterium]|nr:MAG: YbbR-like domain-containing protein [Bacteroidota bacterium]